MISIDNQVSMFDCSYRELDRMIADYIGPLEMLSMSILSDAQEAMSLGHTNLSRQYMNRAKYVLSVIMERNMKGAA